MGKESYGEGEESGRDQAVQNIEEGRLEAKDMRKGKPKEKTQKYSEVG